MSEIPTIKTERLILRPWRKSDLEPFAKLNSDPKVMEFIPIPISHEESDAMVKEYEEEWKLRNYGRWALEVPGVSDFVGYVGFHHIDFIPGKEECIEIGWRLAADYWGKGYASEGAIAALDYGFNTLKLHEFLAFTFNGNTNSRKLMERIGMTYEPTLNFDNPFLPNDHPMRPYVVYRINSFDAIPRR